MDLPCDTVRFGGVGLGFADHLRRTNGTIRKKGNDVQVGD